MARRVRGLREMPDSAMLRRVLAALCEANGLPVTGKMWGVFRRYLKAVRHPVGVQLREAVLAANVEDLPDCGRRYTAEDKPELILLVKLLRVLGRLHRGAPFALSVRTAAGAVGTSRSDADRMLRRLRADGVVELAEKGLIGPRSRSASTWRFTGDSAAG